MGAYGSCTGLSNHAIGETRRWVSEEWYVLRTDALPERAAEETIEWAGLLMRAHVCTPVKGGDTNLWLTRYRMEKNKQYTLVQLNIFPRHIESDA